MDVAPIRHSRHQRGPGRPKKSINNNDSERLGIINAPGAENQVVNLLYCNPFVFKHIFKYVQVYEISEIFFVFTEDKMTIIGTDISESNFVEVTFPGSKMNAYYCANPITVCVPKDSISCIIKNITKSTDSILIMIANDCKKNMMICLARKDDSAIKTFNVLVSNTQSYIPEIEPNSGYSVKITLPINEFKMSFASVPTDVKSTGIFGISIMNDIELIFCNNHRLTVKTFISRSDPNVVCSLNPDETIYIGIAMNRLVQLSRALSGQSIILSIGQGKRLNFNQLFDEESEFDPITLRIQITTAKIGIPSACVTDETYKSIKTAISESINSANKMYLDL